MRELTQEIRDKIKLLAIEKLQDGNALQVVNEDELIAYCNLLENLYKNDELEIK